MQYSIIITFYKNTYMLKHCLYSLMITLKTRTDVEIIIVNDNPTINLAAQFHDEDYLLPMRIIQLEKNLGHSGACSVGVNNSKGLNLVFIDADIIVSDNWLVELEKTFFGHSNCGAATSTILDFSTNQIVYFGMELFKSESIKPLQGSFRQSQYLMNDHSSQIVTSGCMIISKDTYIEVGGFDETFYNSCNDLDLSMKLNAFGYENFISANSIVYHRGNVSGPIRFSSHIYSRSFFFQKWSKIIEEHSNKSLSVLEKLYELNPYSIGDCLVIDFSSSIFSDSYLNCLYKAKRFNLIDKYRIRVNSEKIIITDYVLWDICQINTPIIYFVDDYRHIMSNYLWFKNRKNHNDFIIDRNGNIVKPKID